MVRTKADGGDRKAVAAKAPRKALAPTRAAPLMSPKAGSKKDKYGGGNSVCPRPIPGWQKPVTDFFTRSSKLAEKENEDPDTEAAPSSSKDSQRIEEEAQGSSSSSRVEEDQEMEDEDEQEEEGVDEEEEERVEEEEEEDEEEEKPAKSSSRKFKRNKCVSDDSDESDDE